MSLTEHRQRQQSLRTDDLVEVHRRIEKLFEEIDRLKGDMLIQERMTRLLVLSVTDRLGDPKRTFSEEISSREHDEN